MSNTSNRGVELGLRDVIRNLHKSPFELSDSASSSVLKFLIAPIFVSYNSYIPTFVGGDNSIIELFKFNNIQDSSYWFH